MGIAATLLAGIALLGPGANPQESGSMRLYVGTYTGKGSEGIYLLEMDPRTGALESKGLAGKTDNPSFLVLHPDGRSSTPSTRSACSKGSPAVRSPPSRSIRLTEC